MSATPASASIPLEARVEVAAGQGKVRFVGQTAFAAGKWVGIELDEAGTGKNDGSVQGKVYFSLEKAGTLSGVFVRPSQVHVLDGDNEEEVFAVPAPPKSRSPSSASVLSRSTLASPAPAPPSTPGTARRLSARPASSVAPYPSPRSSLSRTSSSVSSAAGSSGTTTPARPGLSTRPSTTATSRIVPTPSASSSRRESLASIVATPRRTSATSANSEYATSTNRNVPPTTPRPPSAASSGIPSTAGRARPVTPRTESGTSEVMQRNVSSSSSASSASMVGSSRPMSRIQSLQRQQSQSRLPAREAMLEYEEPDLQDTLQEDGQDSPSHQPVQRRSSKQAITTTAEELEKTRFSLAPSAPISTSMEKQASQTVSFRVYEELQHKFRLLESGRQEDRSRLIELEAIKHEYEAYSLSRPKLQSKLVELSGEVKDLRRQIKEGEGEREENKRRLEELEERLEMEALDKEVAEEKLEMEVGKLEAAKERVAEMEIELEVIRKEERRIVSEAGGGGGGVMTEEGGIGENKVKDSLAFIQLAKQNERLKEALMRLRDLTTENEQENKRRILDLEKELDLTSDLQATFDITVEQLEQAEGMVENLKLQLDDAMGAEDMLEHLTERNLTLSERIEEMHAVIQDLEALKELNDELEENHVENEKQMQEEIDLRELQLKEQRKQLDTLEDGILDYEGTISQFRELVLSLQGDIGNLREQHETQQSEKQTLSSQSQAMLNLNMKLQSTVLRNQSKTIDFELRKFEAVQAQKQLQILTPYLPPAFFEDDKAAIEALLFFERLGCKTDILIHAIDQTHGLNNDGTFPDTIPETLVHVCEARTKLSRFMILCKRFTVNLQRCDSSTFIRMGKVYMELSSIEKRLDGFIDLAKREELKEADCGNEIERYTAQAAHVAESHLGESELDYGEQQLGLLLGLDMDLDTFVAGVGYTKQAVALLGKDQDVTIETGDADLDEVLFARLQGLIDSARALKAVSKKLVRRAEEVSAASKSIRPEVSEPVQGASVNMRSIAAFSSRLADLISRYTLEVRTSKEPFQLSTFFGITQEAASDIKSQSKDLLGVEVVLRNLQQTLGPALAAALEPENVVTTGYEAPWVSRVTEMQTNAAKDVEAERKVIKLSEDVKDLAREIRVKEQTIQEAAVKIELMEKRMESVKKQADAIADLESEINKAKLSEKESEATVAQLQTELDDLGRENVKLKQTAPAEKGAGPTADVGEYTTFTGSLETSHLVSQIESLRGTVRFLRNQNTFLKSQDLFKELNQLPAYESVVSTAESERSRTFREESSALLKQVASLSSRSRVIDLSKVEPGKSWQPNERKPSAQLAAKRAQLLQLKAKVDRLAEERSASVRLRLPSVVKL